MLANRADIYNLGDIIGGKSDVFEMSYIENSLTSNSVLEKLRHKNQSDIYVLMEAAKEGNSKGLQLEGNHTPEEVKEYVVLMRMMITVRDIVLCVNKEYIDSAAQAEEYRTEPPFKLQGSYRDMNKMVEKLSPLMNEQELKTLILSHYENESQTLTQAAEFNFLKLKELFQVIGDLELKRKQEILKVFQRNLRLKGLGGDRLVGLTDQIERISNSLNDISKVLGNESADSE
jgi:hypothetical protein